MPRPEHAAFAVFPLLAAGLLFCASPRAAQSPKQQLKSIEKQSDETREQAAQYAQQAEALAAEIARLRDDSINAAKAAQDHETALSDLDDRLAALAAEEASKAAELKRHHAQQIQLLMALERLARNPPEGLALAPGDPVDAVRSALLLGAAVPPLQAQARRLRQEIEQLAQLRQQIAEAQERHRTERLALDKEQTSLSALIARKTVLQQEAQKGAEESGQRLAQLATQATNLHQLIDRLEAERRAHEAERQRRQAEETRRHEEERLARLREPRAEQQAPGVEVAAPSPVIPDPSKPKILRPFAKARGALLYPASGMLMRRYGENDELGVASKGLTFETRPGAQVIAPYDGQVLFAGPFKGYGQILIIEHSDGYHSLLAGLDRVESTAGQWLVAGEPVGVMPGGESKPRLYLELRHDGQPINPMPWLATRDEKVSG